MRRHVHVENAAREVAVRLNQLNGGGQPRGCHQSSLGQQVGLEHIREVLTAVGPPDLTAAAALRGLCGHAPGYQEFPEPTAKYQKGLVS